MAMNPNICKVCHMVRDVVGGCWSDHGAAHALNHTEEKNFEAPAWLCEDDGDRPAIRFHTEIEVIYAGLVGMTATFAGTILHGLRNGDGNRFEQSGWLVRCLAERTNEVRARSRLFPSNKKRS